MKKRVVKYLSKFDSNGMLQDSFGSEVIFSLSAALYCSDLGFNAMLASPR